MHWLSHYGQFGNISVTDRKEEWMLLISSSWLHWELGWDDNRALIIYFHRL